MRRSFSSCAVFFDLDGTLVDSAPDLAGAANDLRAAEGLAPLPLERLRPMVGAGARGMIGTAFGIEPDDPRFAALRDRFLDTYERRLTQATRPFPGVEPVLHALQAAGRPWGVVTNKATRFTAPLVRFLGYDTRAVAVVCGDTTPHAKPHPAPLLEAARQAGCEPSSAVYVGDDLRDVQAGAAAGMGTIVAGWGYLGSGEPAEAWGADAIAKSPAELLNLLGLA